MTPCLEKIVHALVTKMDYFALCNVNLILKCLELYPNKA